MGDERHRELEAILSAIHQTSIVLFDREGGVRAAWGAAIVPEATGLTRSTLVGTSVRDHVPSETAEIGLGQIRRVFETGESVRASGKVGLETGEFLYDARLSPIRDGNGRVTSVVGVFSDVTHWVEAQKALRSVEERFRHLCEHAEDMIAEVGPDARIRYVSSNVQRIVGWSPEELVGLGIEELVSKLHAEPRPDLEGDLQQVVSVGPHGSLYRIRDRWEVPRWIETVAREYHTDDGELRTIAVSRDVTHRVQAEERRRRGQKLESLGAMARGIAHDFNNLLVGVLGNAQLLLDLDAPPAVRDAAADIAEASRLAADLVQQLLTYAGEGRLELRSLEISRLVHDTASLLRSAVTKRARLELRPSPQPLWIQGDETRIRQLLLNLVTNASEALGESGGEVVVRTGAKILERRDLARCAVGRDMGAGAYALLEVVDRGCGMDADTLERLFDPFFTTKGRGRGLGLATVLGIVRAHSGAVRVESKPGGGTTVSVFLPMTGSPSREAAASGGAGPTVLVVDDERLVRNVTQRVLERDGYTVITAASGGEALASLEARRGEIAAIVVDLTLPDADGEELFGALRRLDPGVPVVFVSGHGPEEMARRTGGIPGVERVQKPFSGHDLLRALERLLGAAAPE